MFTFSFSSAFAATDAELAAQNEAMTYAENAMAAAASAQKALGNYSTAALDYACLLYTSPRPRDRQNSRMP